VKLNTQPYRNQLENNMIKGEGDNMGITKDMDVIGQGR
jgi:hypothetical protein